MAAAQPPTWARGLNMRALITVLLLLSATTATANPLYLLSGTGAAGSRYILEENFEWTGFAGLDSTNGTWVQGGDGNPNFDYSIAPAPLEGAQSAYFAANDSNVSYTLTTPVPDVYIVGLLRISALATVYLFRIYDGTNYGFVRSDSSGAFDVQAYGGSFTRSGSWSAATTMYFKIRYEVASQTISFWTSPTGEIGTWGTAITNTGAGLTQITKFGIVSTYATTRIIDDLRISTSDINF